MNRSTILTASRRLASAPGARPTPPPPTASSRSVSVQTSPRLSFERRCCCSSSSRSLPSRLQGRPRQLAPPRLQWESRRYASHKSTFPQRVRALVRQSPVMAPLAFLGIFLSFCCLGYATYYYVAYIAFIDTTYPEPVAKKLKRALYYAQTDVQPQKSWDYFREALAACDEAGLHPFSDEVLGIKLVSADMLEKTGHVPEAIKVLDVVRADSLRFVDWCDAQRGREGKREGLAASRTRVLARTVGICVKLAELRAGPHVDDGDGAERDLVQGVELALAEQQRRERASIPQQSAAEGAWMTAEQLGGALEALADHYEARDRHALAAPLYLRAVTLAQPPSCHTAVLMNNLAASLAQTSPDNPPATSSPDDRPHPPTSRPALLDNARQWTDKALQVGRGLAPPQRTPECDVACAVATHNLGEFAEMEGLVAQARAAYQEARGLARAIGYEEGVAQADEGLKRLSSAP